MTKLLTICIPTYKRPNTLRRCINSVAEQIQRFGLEEQVGIYVTNDASPDNTAQVLEEFSSLNCFKHVNREKNLGMSANIKCMLEEALLESTFQLIITDDDYLQPDILDAVVKFLVAHDAASPNVPLILPPRYSYLEDGNLLCIVCKPFQGDTLIQPSTRNVGRYMFNGFVLSGLIVKSSDIDFSLWNENLENAYFPVIFSGELMLRKPCLYWDMNIVHHTVMNKCPWERWGQSDAEISLRRFTDFINAYVVIGRKVKPTFQSFLYYISAFSSICTITNNILISSGDFYRLSVEESASLLSLDRVSFSRVEPPARILLFIAAVRIVYGCLSKAAKSKLLSFLAISRSRRESSLKDFTEYQRQLSNVSFLMRWVR